MIEVVEREYKVEEGLKLKLGNVNGRIRIEGYDGDTIKLKAEKKWGLLGTEPKIKVKKEGNMLKIEVKHGKSFGVSMGESAVNFDILVPKIVEIEKVGNVNGSISVKNIEKAGKVATVNGSITVENVFAGKISTVNGSIKAMLSSINGDLVVSTVNGSVEVYLSKDSNIEVNARSVNGKIASEIPGELSKSPFHGPKSFKGVLGEGKYNVKISTVNGNISIKAL